MSSLRETLLSEGAKLAGHPSVAKLVQDERFMRAIVTAMSMPGRVYNFTQEQRENFAKTMGLATADEVADLKRIIASLEDRVRELER